MFQSEIKEPLVPNKKIDDIQIGNQIGKQTKFLPLTKLAALSKTAGMQSFQQSENYNSEDDDNFSPMTEKKLKLKDKSDVISNSFMQSNESSFFQRQDSSILGSKRPTIQTIFSQHKSKTSNFSKGTTSNGSSGISRSLSTMSGKFNITRMLKGWMSKTHFHTQDKLLQNIIDAYISDVKPTPAYVSTSGFDCHDVAVMNAPQKNGEVSQVTIVMDQRKLMEYNQKTSEYRLLYEVSAAEDGLTDQTNMARFRISQNQQMLCFMDNQTIATIDMKTRMEIACRKRNFNSSNCIVNELFVAKNGSFFIAQLDCSINKYKSTSCKETHAWHSNGKVLDMQVEESHNRILVLCSPSQGVYFIQILRLKTLEAVKKIEQSNNLQGVTSIHYSRKSSLLVCNKQQTKTLKLLPADPDFTQNWYDKVSVLDSIETDEKVPMVEHTTRQLLFIGGIKNMIVLDLPNQLLIARFKFLGDVKSILLPHLPTDTSGIQVLCKRFNTESNEVENSVHHITFESVYYRQLAEYQLRDVRAMCINEQDFESIYVAGDHGKTIYKFDLYDKEQDLSQQRYICQLDQGVKQIIHNVKMNKIYALMNDKKQILVIDLNDPEKIQEFKIDNKEIKKIKQIKLLSIKNDDEDVQLLVILCRDVPGVFMYDCVTFLLINEFKAQNDMIKCMETIDSVGIVLTGSNQGILRSHNFGEDDLDSVFYNMVHGETFCDLNVGISAIQCSHKKVCEHPTIPNQLVAVGTVRGQVIVYKVKNIKDEKNFQYYSYQQHNDRVTQLCFIHKTDSDQQLASIGDNFLFNVVCLKQRINLFRRNYDWLVPSIGLVFAAASNQLIAIQKSHQLLYFKTELDTEEVQIVKKRISCDLESNIKRTLLRSNQTNKFEACMRHIRDQDFYQLSNINKNTFAIQMGKKKLLEVTSKHHDVLFGFQNKSLIQICKDMNDTDSWPIILEKCMDTGSYINLETLLLLLAHNEQTTTLEYLRSHQILDSEFNNIAQNQLPIMGVIKQSYLFSDEKQITPEMIETVVDTDIDNEDRQKIVMRTLQVPVNPVLGSQDTLDYLEVICDAPTENLMLAQSSVFVEIMWQKHRMLVIFQTQLYSVNFINFVIYTLFYLDSLHFTQWVHIVSTILISLEIREMYQSGYSYFQQIWNWLDMFGNLSIFFHCVLFEIYDKGILQKRSIKQNLIFALFATGARSVSSLRIFKEYRIFIELLKQTFNGMSTFFTLLLFNIFIFTLMRYIRTYEPSLETKRIFSIFISQYEIMFGENPEVEDLESSNIFFFNYIGFTCIVNIVSLNLLIAVISNTFDSVQSSIEAHHLRTKAEILQDISSFQTWNRSKSERLYLHVIQTASSKLEDLQNEEGGGGGHSGDEFTGRVRVITNKIIEMQQEVKEVKDIVKKNELVKSEQQISTSETKDDNCHLKACNDMNSRERNGSAVSRISTSMLDRPGTAFDQNELQEVKLSIAQLSKDQIDTSQKVKKMEQEIKDIKGGVTQIIGMLTKMSGGQLQNPLDYYPQQNQFSNPTEQRQKPLLQQRFPRFHFMEQISSVSQPESQILDPSDTVLDTYYNGSASQLVQQKDLRQPHKSSIDSNTEYLSKMEPLPDIRLQTQALVSPTDSTIQNSFFKFPTGGEAFKSGSGGNELMRWTDAQMYKSDRQVILPDKKFKFPNRLFLPSPTSQDHFDSNVILAKEFIKNKNKNLKHLTEKSRVNSQNQQVNRSKQDQIDTKMKRNSFTYSAQLPEKLLKSDPINQKLSQINENVEMIKQKLRLSQMKRSYDLENHRMFPQTDKSHQNTNYGINSGVRSSRSQLALLKPVQMLNQSQGSNIAIYQKDAEKRHEKSAKTRGPSRSTLGSPVKLSLKVLKTTQKK